MLIEKKLYITIVRERTNERIKAPLGPVMNRIKTYDEKQSFMNMLGQDTFWKKNRLDLWSALKSTSIDDQVFNTIPDDDRIYISRIPFKHTTHMLNDIKIELADVVSKLITERRQLNETNW